MTKPLSTAFWRQAETMSAAPTAENVVAGRIKPSLIGRTTTFSDTAVPAYLTEDLTAVTINDLRASFARYGHHPSPKMWEALGAVAETLTAMAEGTAAPFVHISSLDPGVGKTQSVVHFLRAMLTSSRHKHVSALICANRKSQIEQMVKDAGPAAERLRCLHCGR